MSAVPGRSRLPAAPPPGGPLHIAIIMDGNRRWAQARGLPVLAEDDFGVVFDLGSGATMRLTDIKGHAPSPHTVLGWDVHDIRAAMADLRAKGIRFEIYEGFGQDEDGVWSFGDTHLAWFNDPEGNNLSVAQHG
jgi:catechol 2,3-dioxygenase-like lactoylglutathione lyase family enzyme